MRKEEKGKQAGRKSYKKTSDYLRKGPKKKVKSTTDRLPPENKVGMPLRAALSEE